MLTRSKVAAKHAKYIIQPATAEQISQAVGVTPEEAAYVRRVLIQMGYLRNVTPEERAAAGLKRSYRR